VRDRLVGERWVGAVGYGVHEEILVLQGAKDNGGVAFI
jgi:hypothetical protein